MAITLLVLLLLSGPVPLNQPEAGADHAAIRQALLDYAEGFYDHAPERMTRAVAPALTKRALMARPGVPSFLVQMNSEMLIEATRGTAPSPTAAERQIVVEVLDVSGDMASARVFSVQFNDYVHLIKRDGRWTLLNVLWHPPPAARPPQPSEALASAAREYAAAMADKDGQRLTAVVSPVAAFRTLSASRVVMDRNVESTAAVIGTRTTVQAEVAAPVTVLGTDGDIASVKVGTGPAVTYLHMALQNGRWLVVNTLAAAPPR
jgi:Putative lumazine-binding